MGGWDYYCALCGGPFGPIFWGLEGPDDDEYDPEVLHNHDDPELQWLQDNRIIGEDTESKSVSKVWLSGPAEADDYGTMQYEVGDDPVLQNMPNSGSISVYAWDADDPWCAPFHTRCRDILCRYMGVPELNKDIFFETLKSMAEEDQSGRCLDLDYGEISENMGQYWSTRRDAEYLVFNPVEVRGLQEFYSNLPPRVTDSMDAIRVYGTKGDPFSKLSPDIMLLIISHLKKVDTLYKLRQASPAFANLELSNGFWRTRLRDDMPWLWDLPTPTFSQLGDVDWKKVYHKLDFGSRRYSQNQNKFHGLCNRKRIWEQMCPDFAETYAEYTANVQAWGSAKPLVLNGATTKHPFPLGGVAWGDSRATTETLLDFFSDLSSAKPYVVVSWTTSGYLLDIHILQDQDHTITRKHRLLPDSTEKVIIPEDDWITGFIATSREDLVEGQPQRRYIIGLDILFAKQLPVQLGSDQGDKRLFYVDQDHFIVALKLYCTEEGLLSRMSLIEQPLTHAGGCPRVADTFADNYSLSTTAYSWSRELPPGHIHLSRLILDRFASLGLQDRPMERLMFGATEEELADITGISIDIQLGGIEVSYGHRPTRRIGRRFQAMKTMQVDGRGGERLVQAYATAQPSPNSLTFLTNRDRCLSVGQSVGSGGPLVFAPKGTPSNIALCGVFGRWERFARESYLLRSVGALGSAIDGLADANIPPPLPEDTNGYYWEPSMLPPALIESGTIWGSRVIEERSTFGTTVTRTLKSVPSRGCTIGRLDCSRPVSEVLITLVHSTSKQVVAPVTAITFKYAEGDSMTVGPDRFPEEPTCGWCDSEVSIVSELEQVPHYRQEAWRPGGKPLAFLRIWRSATMSLGAIQFVAADGTESPIWGYWGFDTRNVESNKLHFAGEGGGEAVGLKLFFEGIGRRVFGDDTVLVAIQALTLA